MKIDYNSLNHLPNEFTSFLKRIMENVKFDGAVLVDDAEKLAGIINEDQTGLMLVLLSFSAQFSKPEISKFNVCAIVQGISGNLYFGNNIEYAKEGQAFTIHAEQGGMINAFYHSEKGINRIAVSYIPCALCRQFMKETVTGSTMEIILPGRVKYTLADLYPHSFGPTDLAIEKPLFANEKRQLKLNRKEREGKDELLIKIALDAAEKSYAVYTGNYAGVALELKDDRIISGSLIENAAFVINHNPLSSALVILNIMDLSYTEITKAVLVEEESLTTQGNQVRILLNAVAPHLELIVIKAKNNN